jgi:hypothetical protein
VLNSSEPTLTRVDVHPISSYNSFLDGVLVVDGSSTHEPNNKDRNPWKSMKPVTMHPTGRIVFVWGWGDFLILVFPMCSIWLAQPIPSSFELLSIMFPIYSSSSKSISHSATLSFFP